MSKLNLILILLINTCCNRSISDFTLYNKKPDLDHLRIDGIYYRLLPPELVSKFMRDTLVNGFILYQDGIYLSFPSYEIYRKDVESTLKNAVNNSNIFQKRYPSTPGRWGAYEITSDTLHIQYFVYYEGQTSLLDRYYLIKNDSTLEKIITEDAEKIYDQERYNLFKLFRTKQKPDSVNVFKTNKRIKNKLDRLYSRRVRKQ